MAQALIDNLDDQQIQTMIRNAVFTQLSENAWGHRPVDCCSRPSTTAITPASSMGC